MNRGPFLLLHGLPLFASVTSTAENWPQFRGPTGQDHSTETGLPMNWSATHNLAWKTLIPGESWSSPIVWADRVLVTTATDGGESCRVLALDRKSGTILWNKEVFRQVLRRKEGRNTYATPTPATDGERVYACFGDGGIATGQIVWQERVGGNFSASPVAAEGRIYFVSDEGETTIIEADPEFKVLAKNRLGEKAQAAPEFSSALAGAVRP